MHVIDQLRTDVERLATPKGRRVCTPGHAEARGYLVGRMEEEGLSPYHDGAYELPYSMAGGHFVNLLGRIPGSDPRLAPVYLIAHYDTVGNSPGANDNAAAIAAVLSSIKPLSDANLERDIVVAFFDAEEPPNFLSDSMGSIHFYHHQRMESAHCAIVLDIVGHDVIAPGMDDVLFVIGMESDSALDGVFRQCADATGLRPIPSLNRYIGDLSDQHVFRVEKQPYLFLTGGHCPAYHQPEDTIDKVNFEKLAAVTTYLQSLATATCTAHMRGDFEAYDTTATELEFLNLHIGSQMNAMGLKLDSREAIDTLAELLIERFGV